MPDHPWRGQAAIMAAACTANAGSTLSIPIV
jgi:hypothetical protein